MAQPNESGGSGTMGCLFGGVVGLIIAAFWLDWGSLFADLNRPGGANGLEPLLWLVAGLVGLVVYLVPALIAQSRNHPQFAPILVVNLLLGWTFLAWVICLAWAVSGPSGKKR